MGSLPPGSNPGVSDFLFSKTGGGQFGMNCALTDGKTSGAWVRGNSPADSLKRQTGD